jgi:hypothetical protein
MLSHSIEIDARRNSKLKADLDNFRSKYIEVDFEKGLSVQFPSGEIWTYEQFLFINIANARLVDFKSRWNMRPDYTSYDFYGTEIYWTLILHVNGIHTQEEFTNLDKILIPSVSNLLNIIRNKLPKNQISQVISNPPAKFDQSLDMLSRSPLDDMELQRIQSESRLSDDDSVNVPTYELLSVTDTFTLSSEDITNKYVILSEAPVNSSSVSLYVDGFSIPQRYGYDYILKPNTNGKIDLVSWAEVDVIGTGMETVLDEGIEIQVVYLYENIVEGT